MIFEARNTIGYDHRSVGNALPVIAFASRSFGEQLERAQDMALSYYMLRSFFYHMNSDEVYFRSPKAMQRWGSHFGNLACAIRMQKGSHQGMGGLNTQEHGRCQDSSAR